MHRVLAVLALAALASCAAGREYFIPRENLRAQSPRGWPAAEYKLEVGGAEVGTAKVWSEGAAHVRVGDDRRTVMHVGFEVENKSRGPLQFDVDQCRVTNLQTDHADALVLEPHDESGKLTVEAGQIGLLDFEFLLPPDTLPREIDSFRVTWVIGNEAEMPVKSTPFRVDEARYYYRRSYYYDPWWHVGVGWHFGHHWHHGHWHHHGWWGPRVHFWAW
jgi:hypothetical protein